MELEADPSVNASSPDSSNSSWPAPPPPALLAALALLALLALLTALGNGAVILAICTTRKLRLPANYLICSLAVTDLLVALLVMPVSIAHMATQTWRLGEAACELWLCVDMTCCTCSILHLCLIALDRYWAITRAVEYARKRSARRAAAMVGVAWVISVFISLPPLFWRRRASDGGGPQHCSMEHEHLGYTLYSTFGAFYIPMVLLLILYSRIYSAAKTLYQKRGSSRHLSGRSQASAERRASHAFCISEPSNNWEQLGAAAAAATEVPCPRREEEEEEAESDDRSQISSSRERKAARILGLILGAFVCCWLPFFLKELLAGLRLLRPSPPLSDALTWLGYVNSLVNPLLYTSFNDDFKLAFRKLLGRREQGKI
ncbi:5-hydroxytryptamine receptor 1E [Nelusetta ayraudi]|uniref:5-hydroxytryptamine receptor 1E n=1 Tax=Nelusetta ayraudi TaxID=303726 RepID=UPI003F6EB847